jgi:uncharacterized protein
MVTISHKTLNLIKNLLFAFFLLGQIAWGKGFFQIKNPSGVSVKLKLALTQRQHTEGLSGLRPKQFKKTEGMLFVNSEMGTRRFWMPNTYFNLDIIFLDQNLKIVGIEKNVPSHPGMIEPPSIYKTESYQAQYVLETKSGAAFGKNLNKNNVLRFSGPTSLSEIALSTISWTKFIFSFFMRFNSSSRSL